MSEMVERVAQAMRDLVHRADLTMAAGQDATWEAFARAAIDAASRRKK